VAKPCCPTSTGSSQKQIKQITKTAINLYNNRNRHQPTYMTQFLLPLHHRNTSAKLKKDPQETPDIGPPSSKMQQNVQDLDA